MQPGVALEVACSGKGHPMDRCACLKIKKELDVCFERVHAIWVRVAGYCGRVFAWKLGRGRITT